MLIPSLWGMVASLFLLFPVLAEEAAPAKALAAVEARNDTFTQKPPRSVQLVESDQ